jgi:ATP-dependent Clp protease, protease subunit
MATKKRCKKTLYSFDPKEVLQQHRQLFLYTDINNNSANYIKQSLIAFDIISKDPITIWITSPGGSCSAGLSIIEVMTRIQSPIITIISGEVASMASHISINGDERWMFSTGVWMQHPLASGQRDYLPFIKDRTAFLSEYDVLLQKNMHEKTKLTLEDYKKIEAGELWLFADEALKKGIVDKIL